MKKFFVRLLFDLGFRNLAYRISPQLYIEYYAEVAARLVQEAIDKIGLFATSMANAAKKIQEVNNGVQKPDSIDSGTNDNSGRE